MKSETKSESESFSKEPAKVTTASESGSMLAFSYAMLLFVPGSAAPLIRSADICVLWGARVGGKADRAEGGRCGRRADGGRAAEARAIRSLRI